MLMIYALKFNFMIQNSLWNKQYNRRNRLSYHKEEGCIKMT